MGEASQDIAPPWANRPAGPMSLPCAGRCAGERPVATKISPLGTAFIQALASGSLLGLAWLCPPYLGPLLACGALVPLFALWRDEDLPGRLALASSLAMLWAKALALGYFLAVDPWLALVNIVLQALASAWPWLLLALIARLFVCPPRRFLSWLPALWLGNEWLLGQIPALVPMPLGGTLGPWPSMLWFYDLTGVAGGSLLLLLIALYWVSSPLAARGKLLWLGTLLLCCHVLGLLRPLFDAPGEGDTPIALLRSGPLRLGDDPLPWFDRALQRSSEAVEAGARLVIWPEAQVPWPVSVDEMHPLHQVLSRWAQQTGVPLLIGHDEVASPFELYNSATLLIVGHSLLDSPKQRKRSLMPFRESAVFGLGRDVVKAGEEVRALPWSDAHGVQRHLGALICYEVLIAQAAHERVLAGAQLLVVLANDVEFDLLPAQWQLLAQARVRAAETRRDLLRVASVGPVQHIDAYGGLRAEARSPADVLLVTPQWRSDVTFWSRQGALIDGLLIVLALAPVWLGRWRAAGCEAMTACQPD